MIRSYLLLLSFCCATLGLFAQTTTLPLTDLGLNFSTDDRMDQFEEYRIVRLDIDPLYRLWEAPEDHIAFTLEDNGQQFNFELDRLDLRRPGYTLTSGSRDDRSFEIHPRLPAAQFRGSMNGTDAPAIFTIDENFVLGHWTVDGERFYLEPLWRFADGVATDVYILYGENGIDPYIGECGAHGEDFNAPDPEPIGSGQGRSAVDGECIEVEIALASDFEHYQQLNSSATQVENFMLNSLALVQTNYDSQIGDEEFDDELNFFVTDTYIATSNASDPWTNDTDPEILLPDFRSWGNNGGFNAAYDVATLWSGRDFDGSTVGLAYVGVICSGSRYNTNENFSTNSASIRVLWAHELGHNFSSSHDDTPPPYTTIMAPSVNITDTWSQQSRDAINAHYQSRSCLSNCAQSAPTTAFSVSESQVCPGSQINFVNQTSGSVSSFQWSFPGGNPSSSTELNPAVTYNNAGSYIATLTATNAAGSTSAQEFINVSPGNTNSVFFEDFENGLGGVQISNPDNGTTWTTRQITGNGSSQAAYLNNYNYEAQGQVDGLVLPAQDMLANTNLRLSFEYAYARYNATFKDQLRVRVVTSNGSTDVFLGDEDGSGNFATDNDQTSFFSPSGAQDWCFNGPQCVDLDLSAFNGFTSVQVFIENINGYGNSLYVDNVELISTCSPSNPLPVEWLSFWAEARPRAAYLNWAVEQDAAHAGFYVERALADDPAKWDQIDFVERYGDNGTAVDYAYEDFSVRPGGAYLYRLRQLDVDGSEDISVIRPVNFTGKDREVEVWPNPSQGNLNLVTGYATGNYQLLDLNGRVISSGLIATTLTQIQLHDLAAGVYWLRVTGATEGQVQTVKVVRQ
ncbi:hypothetical protein CEQ90_07210 [Lewinellaceae bacterium SD302]|nr:hypothetical protein CEQ90_07210 [Lewinellaceae bacterium SD302]